MPRVLVVDDSEVIRDLITLNLRLEGFEVFVAEGGEEAISLLPEARPQVITLDVVMPVVDGFEVVQRLRHDPDLAAYAGVPVVMVTGRSHSQDLARGEALGVEAYVTKPFEPSELMDAVRNAMAAADTLRA